jgi:hypothetical protein
LISAPAGFELAYPFRTAVKSERLKSTFIVITSREYN